MKRAREEKRKGEKVPGEGNRAGASAEATAGANSERWERGVQEK